MHSRFDRRAPEIARRCREPRLDVARALLRKALTEIGGTATRQTRLVGFREAANVGAT